jgi:hypothetical protein
MQTTRAKKPLPPLPILSEAKEVLYATPRDESSSHSSITSKTLSLEAHSASSDEEEEEKVKIVHKHRGSDVGKSQSIKEDSPSINDVPNSLFGKKKHYKYVVISEVYADAKKLSLAIQGEYHMHVKASSFVTLVSEEFVIIVCTPKTIFNHCRVANSLIRTQNGKVAVVCILSELARKEIVANKSLMMSLMDEDHILFASYDKEGELTNLYKFWVEIENIIKMVTSG